VIVASDEQAPPVRARVWKWAPWALLVVVAVVGMAIGLHRSSRPTLDSRVQHIASQVRCPVCNGETVAQSQAAVSVEIRSEIRADLQRGQSQDQILSSLVSSYGPGILEKPEAQGIGILVWIVPVLGLVLGAAGLMVALRRWRSGPASAGRDTEAETEPGASLPAPAAAQPESEGPEPVGREPVGTEPEEPESDEPESDGPAPEAPGPIGPPARPGRRRARIALAVLGVVLVAGGASWAVAAASGTRLPGQAITGASLTPEKVVADLQKAQDDEDRNDSLDALQLYQKVLQSDPTQVQALSGAGWLLAQTGQPALLRQGLGLLQQAEQVQPTFAPAHLYRGLAFLSESDYGDAVPELQWYLDHSPDQSLVAMVQKALAQAKSGAAAAGAAPSASVPAPTTTTPKP